MSLTPRGPEAEVFADRAEAGRRLADALAAWRIDSPVILALPRGGVPVACEIARRLDAPLDLILVRKIGTPNAPELAAAAVVDGPVPILVRNEDVLRAADVSESYLAREQAIKLEEIARRRQTYLAGRARPDLAGRAVIVVDDGIATGTTALAALRAVRSSGAGRTILAVPVAPADTLERIGREVDDIVCLAAPENFSGVGQFYADFHQLSDEEVTALLDRAARPDGDE